MRLKPRSDGDEELQVRYKGGQLLPGPVETSSRTFEVITWEWRVKNEVL
jgi:hypothetical protein